MGFREIVHHALEDWDKYFEKSQVELVEQGDARKDAFRTQILQDLRDLFGVHFRGWDSFEVLVFCLNAYPRCELRSLTSTCEIAMFFDVVFEMWQPPSLACWLHMLWNFTKRSFGLFSDILYIVSKVKYVEPQQLGLALFRDFVELDTNLRCYTLASFVGALVESPNERTMAKQHAEKICQLTKDMTPEEVGFVCRCLLLFRTRKSCRCGYECEETCSCGANPLPQIDSAGDRNYVSLDRDHNKEYATALLRNVDGRRKVHVESKFSWTETQKATFLRSACEYIYSREVYVEIFQNLNGGEKPSTEQQHERKLTAKEENMNALKRRDQTYDHSDARHAGCVTSNCKQAYSLKCDNSCCGQCCKKFGVNHCTVHRNYAFHRQKEPDRENVEFEGSYLKTMFESNPSRYKNKWSCRASP